MGKNNINIQGVIPASDKLTGAFEFFNNDPNKTPMLNFLVSVRRAYKPEGEKFYPEDLIPCKAFGKTAENINRFFGKGQPIQLDGSMYKDAGYEKDGVQQPGRWYVHVNGFDFIDGLPRNEETETEMQAAAPAVTAKPAASPITARPAVGRGVLNQTVASPFGNRKVAQ